jgi:glycosyltransferase involved in cell wall biosynthesis
MSMNWLFVHQACLGQYAPIAEYLAGVGHNVIAIAQAVPKGLDGIKVIRYRPRRTSHRLDHRLHTYAAALRNADAVADAATTLKRDGFEPDLMLGHSAWGEILYLKDVWPNRPLLGYFEYCCRATAGEAAFDPEFVWPMLDRPYARSRSAASLASFAVADHGQTATEFQRSTFPAPFRAGISVVHEGVDTRALRPDAATRLRLGDLRLKPGDEVVTYSARGLEPHRGFHVFMRALPTILHRRPSAHVLIVGSGNNCYSEPPKCHRSYAEQMMAEIGGSIDRSRVHFLGFLPPEQYRAVLRVSAAHVYLTYPFVLSWSLIEAMSSGCLIVGSRTPPVEEVITHGENGLLVDFFDYEGLAEQVCYALAHQNRLRRLRKAARDAAIRRFDFVTVCRPAHLRLCERLIGSPIGNP